MNNIILKIGGRVPNSPPDDLNIQFEFKLPYVSVEGQLGLTVQGTVELHNAIAKFYELVGNQTIATRTQYARFWADSIIEQISPVLFGGSFNLGVKIDGRLYKITPNFEYREALKLANAPLFIIVKRITVFFPKYMDAESSGYVQFTPEFNIPTTFDNANFLRAEDDNYTNFIDEFIISPQFNLALHIRPKITKKCKKCKKCKRHKCKCNKKQPYTTSTALQAFVTFMYQVCQKIQREEITFEEGKALIDEKVEFFSKYRTEGAFTYELELDSNGFVELSFCVRYHLENTDCIVGFTMQGIYDIFTGRPEPIYNQVIMGASSVPIDEDMSDVNYPSNTGVFIYKRSNE